MAAGACVNILFGILVYFILMIVISFQYADLIGLKHLSYALFETKDFIIALGESLKMLFTGNVGVDQMVGPVGISEVVANTSGLKEYIYILAVVSVSLGVTNLLPIPALDGGKILILIIEAIRKKPLKEELEIKIQLIGFSVLIALSLIVTYNDITRIF